MPPFRSSLGRRLSSLAFSHLHFIALTAYRSAKRRAARHVGDADDYARMLHGLRAPSPFLRRLHAPAITRCWRFERLSAGDASRKQRRDKRAAFLRLTWRAFDHSAIGIEANVRLSSPTLHARAMADDFAISSCLAGESRAFTRAGESCFR